MPPSFNGKPFKAAGEKRTTAPKSRAVKSKSVGQSGFRCMIAIGGLYVNLKTSSCYTAVNSQGCEMKNHKSTLVFLAFALMISAMLACNQFVNTPLSLTEPPAIQTTREPETLEPADPDAG